MSNSALAAQLTDALDAAAACEAAGAALVSLEITMAVTARAGAVATRTVRKTRTLLFQHAELTDAQGTLVASAASVHRI